MSEVVYFLTISLALGTILVVFGMKYFSAVQQAKARLANDELYRQLAAKASATQAETSQALTSIDASLSDLKGRIAAIEKILKEVE